MRRLLPCIVLASTCLLPVALTPAPGAAQYGSGYSKKGQKGPPKEGGYTPPQPVDEAEIRIYDNYFEPAVILVTPGATIRWVNYGKHTHAVTDLAGAWTSGNLAPGKSYTHKLTHALHHYYYCCHHRLTMSGTIHVQERGAITGPPAPPSKGSQGGYTSPPAGAPGYRPGY